MDLFSLPPELLTVIITLLDVRDILSFCRVCHRAHDFFSNSAVLQYLVTLCAAGMVDIDACSTLSARDRLEYLTRREDMWKALDLKLEHKTGIPVDHRHSHIHDLTSGIYVFGELNAEPDSIRTHVLRYLHLPTCTHEQHNMSAEGSRMITQWKHILLGVEALTFRTSPDQNDLLVVLTSIAVPDADDTHVFQLHLREFSTGRYHPTAREPVIQLREHRIDGNQCIASIDIAGRHILVLLTWLRAPNMPDELFVYDWLTAVPILCVSSGSFTYRAATFLSPEIFILTNMRDNTIEFLRLRKDVAEESFQCRWMGKLALPTLQQGSSLISVNCRTDAVRGRSHRPDKLQPDSASASGTLGTSKCIRIPVQCDPDKVIVQFRMYLQGSSGAPNVGHVSLFSFIAHRGRLLEILQATERIEEGSSSPTEVKTIPWDQWGPELTRWSGTDETDTAWMAGVAGQRQIYITGDAARRIYIRDYNAAVVRKELSRAEEDRPESRTRVISEETVTSHQGCFAADVRSSLPFVEIISEHSFPYDGVLMDETHVIGLTEHEEDGTIRNLDVYIMSPDDPKTCDCSDVGRIDNK